MKPILTECTIGSECRAHIHLRTDEIIYEETNDDCVINIGRTADEQYYVYQKGNYFTIPGKPTYYSPATSEIVQLIEAGEIHKILMHAETPNI